MLEILALDPFNFVPLTRTPWGGARIPALKAAGLGRPRGLLPAKVGESWEVSTDVSFPSCVASADGGALVTLGEALARAPEALLGRSVTERHGGSHCPLLLKWLHAADVLSVQLHPRNGDPRLRPGECGKPEAWFVLEVEPGGHLHLGLREGVGEERARAAFLSGDPASVLFRYEPSPGDYVSIPPGLVHALGPGVLLAEPQYVLSGRSGKTWRLSDWGRRYDKEGRLVPAGDPGGAPRELHVEEAFSSIAWGSPRGPDAVASFVTRMGEHARQPGTRLNPFALEAFTTPGRHAYHPLVEGSFSLATCYAGSARFEGAGGAVELRAGQSAFVAVRPAGGAPLGFTLAPGSAAAGGGPGSCGLAFFALDEEWVDGVPE